VAAQRHPAGHVDERRGDAALHRVAGVGLRARPRDVRQFRLVGDGHHGAPVGELLYLDAQPREELVVGVDVVLEGVGGTVRQVACVAHTTPTAAGGL
jgi:hypothetical protein